MTRINAIKQFFSTPEKPVDNKEMIQFKQQDPTGFTEVCDSIAAQHPDWGVEPLKTN